MTTGYAKRFDREMHRIYGDFQPGTLARAIRDDNAREGLRTCWNCWEAYRSRVVVSKGKRQRIGRGHYFCSRDCYRADRRAYGRKRSIAEFHADGSITFDFRNCRDCPS